ncbi:MAG: 30S ribosomal protein S8 [Candidatus Magasanikbacteria bacterium RIFCSPHIGHO2_02_FULL_51_14]|uniref:Small ribosomal subunit protein uS8 n=1 Tax=Candidatus Magasanikbacteria bacterium RIFCSPHIGHO2_02_FULL_51_14 TaxID=1798683 RepID=A0A1F6MHJ7_9BACT|nr:MAG: 30S ribosomal protein S8 [Candidatus Magasanikbacteria bacterium RIFCSPHIGHO2_02_FULL_51_14]
MMTDQIADMLTRIRNAQMAGKKTVELPFSKIKKAIADILMREGYIASVEAQMGTPARLMLVLKYHGKKPAIQSIARESKPGRRQYRKAGEMPRVLNDYGIAIVSTSQGLMTNKQARKDGVGGEIICSVY